MINRLAEKERWRRWGWRRVSLLAIAALMLVLWWFCLPRPLFRVPLSLVLTDREDQLLGARIAADGQWRFPAPDSLPRKFRLALLHFEDRRFYHHPGVDPLALGRALLLNLRAGRIVSGGSTLTMQVIRLARGNPPRTVGQKLLESLMALRLEMTYGKEAILRRWATHAPYGGNVVGLEAAAWRYYAKRPAQLTWAEAATLAVLPNSPSLIRPGRNSDRLLAKRNALLDRLYQRGFLDQMTADLAKAEPLPGAPHPLPRLAPQLVDRAWQEQGEGRWVTTLDRHLQQRVTEAVALHHRRLAANDIHNLAAVVVDVETGQTLAYVGNVAGLAAEHSPAVDLVAAPRSPGSLLKPLLYGLALQEGLILPGSLLPDVPTVFGGFRPENFYPEYDGAVVAGEALARSLNVPFVHLLRHYGVERFHYALREWGFDYINKPAGHYGLSLILGGCEISLWQAAGWYAGMARVLRHYYPYQGEYDRLDWRAPHYLLRDSVTAGRQRRRTPYLLGAGAAWWVAEAMQEVERPGEEHNWQAFTSTRRLAWKTGTSYGFRDAWAVGLTPRHVVAVWAGNADGEGRPGLVGVQAAAPLLFNIFNSLPTNAPGWFESPYDEWRSMPVCRESGYRALPICPVDTVQAPKAGLEAPPCPYHESVALDATGQWRVNADCEPPDRIRPTGWFVLPALEEYYYRRRHPNYRPLPPWRADCSPPTADGRAMQLIYPREANRIFVPIDLDGRPSATVFSVAHRQADATVFWHLDDTYLGQTRTFHSMELRPPPGPHRIVLVDDKGNRLEQAFEVVR